MDDIKDLLLLIASSQLHIESMLYSLMYYRTYPEKDRDLEVINKLSEDLYNLRFNKEVLKNEKEQ